MYINRTPLFRIISLVLIVLFLCPVCISAVEPRASYYLDSYNAYPYSAGLGKIQIYFNVTGVDYMADIGALNIQIYESTDQINWTWVNSFNNGNTPSILGHDTIFYASHVDHQGTIGRYYKAYICIYAGDGTDGDTRYFWTSMTKATLLAH